MNIISMHTVNLFFTVFLILTANTSLCSHESDFKSSEKMAMDQINKVIRNKRANTAELTRALYLTVGPDVQNYIYKRYALERLLEKGISADTIVTQKGLHTATALWTLVSTTRYGKNDDNTKKNQCMCVDILINANATVDCFGGSLQITPLEAAYLINRPDIARVLLEAGANMALYDGTTFESQKQSYAEFITQAQSWKPTIKTEGTQKKTKQKRIVK